MGRRSLTANVAWDDVHDTILYTAVALKLAGEDGDKEVGALSGGVEKLITKWELMDGERRKARREQVTVHALVRRRLAGLEAAVTGLHNAVLSEVNLNRKAPLFTRLFPKTLSELAKQSLESRLVSTEKLLLKLAETDTPATLRKAHEKPIKEAAAAGAAAIKKRTAAQTASGELAARVDGFRQEINQILLGIEGGLQQLASRRGLGIAFLDGFFPGAKPAARKPAKKPEDPRPAAPAP